VPDELVELVNLVGPESYVKDRIQAFKEAGVTMLNVTPVGENPIRLVEQVKEWIS